MIDLLVAGGGPIGLATALYARRAGLDVVVVEPRNDAIDKACGEGLMPEALSRLADLGVDPVGRPFRGIRYVQRGHVAEATFSAGPGRGVRRLALHAAMRARAEEVGVRFEQGRVTDIERLPDGIRSGITTARYLVGADGLHSTVRTSVGLSSPARGRQRYGLRQHFRVEPWTDLVEVHWLRGAEVYITPVSDDVIGVSVLGGRPLSLEQSLSELPDVSARLVNAEAMSSERGAGPLRQVTSARTAGRVLLVGDAAGYVDALTGEGLRMGFAEAEAAVAAILRGDPSSYEKEWEELTRSYRRLTNGLLWVSARPTLRRIIVPAARAFPGVFRRGIDSIAA
ncbi:MAG: NAD(P)/FAD-dependent oxidoreductase [bacterium]|nr:NAD(P)/FAD-dependent oxidoreductase [bacterium]